MEHFYQLPNFGEDWFTYPQLYKRFVNRLSNNSKIVEVGSWKGKSTAFLGVEIINSGKNIELHAVDTWEGSGEHSNDPYVRTNTLYPLFLANIGPVSSVVKIVRKKSTEAAKDYEDESLDIVFIDACHEYECVSEDIAAWLPKVKIGGILAGHDFTASFPGVIKAVQELLPIDQIETTEMCWVYTKNKPNPK